MPKKVFQSKTLPSTKAPYSQAIIHENLLFVSGQIAFDPKKNGVISGTIEEETELTMNNIKSILNEAGSSLDNVLKVTVFLTDMKKFHKFKRRERSVDNIIKELRMAKRRFKIPMVSFEDNGFSSFINVATSLPKTS